MTKLFVVAAMSLTLLAATTAGPAEALGCPQTCVVSGAVAGTGIVPDPNQLDFTLNWTAADLRGALPATINGTIRVVVNLDLQYTPTGPWVSRGDGLAYIDYDATSPSVDDVYSVTMVRTGYPAAGAITVDGAKLQNEYTGTYALSIDLTYLGFANGTQQYAGAAVELDYEY